MNLNLLKNLILEILKEQEDLSNVRIPNQLLAPTENEEEAKDEQSRTREPIRGQKENGNEVKEFSGAGAGAIAGFTGPLGSTPKRK